MTKLKPQFFLNESDACIVILNVLNSISYFFGNKTLRATHVKLIYKLVYVEHKKLNNSANLPNSKPLFLTFEFNVLPIESLLLSAYYF